MDSEDLTEILPLTYKYTIKILLEVRTLETLILYSYLLLPNVNLNIEGKSQ